MLLGELLKGKKLLRKRGRERGCGDQGRGEDGGTLHSSVSLYFIFFFHPSQFGLWFCICSL